MTTQKSPYLLIFFVQIIRKCSCNAGRFVVRWYGLNPDPSGFVANKNLIRIRNLSVWFGGTCYSRIVGHRQPTVKWIKTSHTIWQGHAQEFYRGRAQGSRSRRFIAFSAPSPGNFRFQLKKREGDELLRRWKLRRGGGPTHATAVLYRYPIQILKFTSANILICWRLTMHLAHLTRLAVLGLQTRLVFNRSTNKFSFY